MIHRANLRTIVLLGLFFSLAGTLSAQRTRNRVLIVNGKTVGAVVQIAGRSYVDIETLAQITNASVTYQPDRITLTIPGSSFGATPPPAPEKEGLSKDFARGAIPAFADMREWKSTIETVINLGVFPSVTFLQGYRDRAETSLRLATIAAATPSDENAAKLLQNEFDMLERWVGNAIATRQALNATRTMNPDALQNDPDLAKISDCAKFLSTMIGSGVFTDNPSCH